MGSGESLSRNGKKRPQESGRHADIYANHLYIADFVRSWSADVAVEAQSETDVLEREYLKGYARALADMSEHLEDGDALPAGPLYARMAARISRERTGA